MMVQKIKIKPFLVLTSLFCTAFLFAQKNPTSIASMEELSWEIVAPGIWKASLGEKELAPMDYARPPRMEELEALGEIPAFPFQEGSSLGQTGPSLISMRLPLEENENIYGLGLEFQGINRRGNVYHLKVDHYGGVKGYTHAPVPFYVSSKGYGVLINTARRPSIHVGVGNRKDSRLPERIDRTTGGKQWQARPLSDAVEFSVMGDGLEIFLFTGKNTLEVVQRYNLFCGGGVLPPRWGLGFWHRMHISSSDADVMKEIEDFKNNNFPLDVIGLEPGWQSFAYPCSFDWDPTRFPDPAGFVKKLDKKGIRVNLWENPYVSPISTMYPDIKPYTGSHTVWLGEVPDYTLPEAQKVMLDHHQKNHMDIGVSGYKFDEVDGYDFWLWPDHASFPSGNDAVQIRQLYGEMIQDMVMDRYRELNTRTYGLVRSSNAGASHLGFVIYSDYYDHKGYVTALINCSLAGVLWTPEIRDAKTSEEWVRRFQTVCFSPMMQLNAWSSGTKPWSFPDVTDEVREVIQLRTSLLPYIYTAFYDYYKKGIPPFRAMVLESGYKAEDKLVGGELHGEENPYAETSRLEVTDQYMMGPSILVAPVFTGQTKRDVVLPKGNWHDFYTGELAGNGETISIDTRLDRIPLFVRDGAIIPMMPPVNNVILATDKIPLEVRHYGTKAGVYQLYDDDGKSFDYEKGIYSLTGLKTENKKGSLQGIVSGTDGPWKSRYGKITWKFMTQE